ncbi:MAG: mandelate racemase/muconate lactonizing enzyme family protein [Streptococcaceae bacterium]|jgi:D-arabinonate dehydratase|nr:mandelate racemase/muconate lactonizing enzyme family protein [Streptococcaceae bacterium]
MIAGNEVITGTTSCRRAEKIIEVKVRRVSHTVTNNLQDATRKIDRLGFVIVEIKTESGHTGIGYTSNGAGGKAVKSVIADYIAPKIIGKDPFESSVIWNEIVSYLRGVGRKGLVFCALSAVDIALWDLKGKLLNLPLYQLFGGKKMPVPIYGSGGWTSYSDEKLVDEMLSMVNQGYRMIKFKVGVDNGSNLRRDLKRVRLVRKAVGDEIKIMLDANNCWDAATGARFANMVKDEDILFLEEPVPADDIPGLIKFKQSTDLPLATGEHEYTKYGARALLADNCVDIIQCDAVRTGGFTELVKICAMAEAWNIRIAPHGRENLHLHLAGVFPNFMALENLIMYEEITAKVFLNSPVQHNGYLEANDLPGIGLILNQKFIQENEEN